MNSSSQTEISTRKSLSHRSDVQHMSADKVEASPVLWQTAFWTLLPLAVNVITQPSGRVLGIEPRYRTYLRSSPIICAADAISVSVHALYVLVRCWTSKVPFRRGFEEFINERFKGVEEQTEGIQALESQTGMRWMFFVLGTLMPTIKLCAMEGVPWTTAWGVMFLVSFVVIEMLVFFAAVLISTLRPQMRDSGEENGQELSSLRPQGDSEESLGPMRRANFIDESHKTWTLESVNSWLAIIASILHIAVLIKAVVEIRPQPDHSDKYPNRLMAEAWFVFMAWLISCVIMAVLSVPIGFISGTISFYITLPDDFTIYMLGPPWIGVYFVALWFLVANEVENTIDSSIPSFSWIFIDFGALLAIPGTPFIVGSILYWSGCTSCRIGKNLSIMKHCSCMEEQERGTRSSPCTVDEWGIITAVFFFCNLSVFVAWYSLKFDPTGTVVPSWTVVFG